MELFFSHEIQPGEFTFARDESRHIIRVLRRKKGDEVMFTDGRGKMLIGQIIDDHPNKCRVNITSSRFMPRQRPYHIHMVVAPTKNIGRFEWFLEKATEIGVDEITPIKCDHSERMHINPDRLEKVIVAALKQSQQFWQPKLNPLKPLTSLLQEDLQGLKYIAYVDEENKTSLKSVYKPGESCNILIGPEGDFSKQEVESAISAGFVQISLGENRLRTETAALVACHTINLLNQQ